MNNWQNMSDGEQRTLAGKVLKNLALLNNVTQGQTVSSINGYRFGALYKLDDINPEYCPLRRTDGEKMVIRDVRITLQQLQNVKIDGKNLSEFKGDQIKYIRDEKYKHTIEGNVTLGLE